MRRRPTELCARRLIPAIVLLAACGGDPEPVACDEEPWQWVRLESGSTGEHVGIDAVSVTTRTGEELFTTTTMEWSVGEEDGDGPQTVLGQPDGHCISFPRHALSYVAAFDDGEDPWDHITVFTCGGDGRYDVRLLVGDGDGQSISRASNARGTTRFDARACDAPRDDARLAR